MNIFTYDDLEHVSEFTVDCDIYTIWMLIYTNVANKVGFHKVLKLITLQFRRFSFTSVSVCDLVLFLPFLFRTETFDLIVCCSNGL